MLSGLYGEFFIVGDNGEYYGGIYDTFDDAARAIDEMYEYDEIPEDVDLKIVRS